MCALFILVQKICKKITILFVLCTPLLLMSQVRVPFTQRTSKYSPEQYMYYLKGDYQLIGNTNLTPQVYTPTTLNSNTQMIYVDIDSDPTTINSSSAALTFSSENGANPNCSDIIYAGLYWTGRSADVANGTDSWVIGGTSSNYTYSYWGTQVMCYNLTMNSSGNNNNNVATYTFTPDNGGDVVIFRFYGGSIYSGGYSLTIQVGNNPPATYSDVTFPTNSSTSSSQNRTVTFNKPYAIKTGSCTIYVNSLTKRTSSNISSNFYVNIVTESVTTQNVGSGYSGGGYDVFITGSGTMESNTTTYTLTGNGETIVLEFSGANSRSVSVTRNGNTENLPATYSPYYVYNSSTTITATLNTPYEIAPGIEITQLTKRPNTSYLTYSPYFNVQFSITTTPITINKNKVMFKHNTEQEYVSVIASPYDIWYPSTTDEYMYVAYAEVTDYVKEHGLGDYFVANMALIEGDGGATGYYGGWGMVVIYQNSLMNWRNITIFDGYAYVDQYNSNIVVDIEGFQTLQEGNVQLKLGVMAGEGDVDISGDYMQIKDQANNYITLSHNGNSTNNFFNSSIYTGGNNRNPNLVNNTGMDVSMFQIDNTNNNVITNNQTATSFRFGSNQDAYTVFCLVMGVDAYIPTLDGVNVVSQINNISIPEDSTSLTVYPGEEMEYRLEVRNMGQEAVVNAQIIIPIPYTAEYLSSNTVYASGINGQHYFDPVEGSAGAIVWTLDEVPTGTINDIYATLYYRFRITDDCSILAGSNCSISNDVSGYISGEGELSNIPFTNISFIQGYYQDGECIGSPIYENVEVVIDAEDYVNENCSAFQDSLVRLFTYCNASGTIPYTDVSGFFPLGTRFYNQYNPSLEDPVEGAVEYTTTTGFPNLYGIYTYYADLPDVGCYSQFQIEVTSFNATPSISTSNLYYCQGDIAVPLTATPSNPNNNLYYFTQLSEGAASTSLVPSTSVVGTKPYYVAEALSNGCVSSQRVPIYVTVYEKPSVALSSNKPNNTICFGDTILLSANTIAGKPFRFDWYNADPSFSSPIVQTTISSLSTHTAGNYWVKVTDTVHGCETINGPLTVVVNTRPVLAGSLVTLCGNSKDTIAISVPGNSIGATVSIVNSSAGSVSIGNNSLIIQTANVATDQNTIVTYTDGNNCATSLELQVNSKPQISLPTSYTVCQNSGDQIITATITNHSDDTLILYNWNNTSYTANSNYTAGTSQPGVQTITLRVTNEDGCVSNNASMTLTVKELPNISLSTLSDGQIVNDSVIICAHEQLILKVSPRGNSRTWTYPVNQSTTSDSILINEVLLSNKGWFKVSVNQPGCIASDSMYLNVFQVQHEPDIILTIMNGSDTIRFIDHHSNPKIDTLTYTDSIWASLYLPPTLYGCDFQLRIFSSLSNMWLNWDTLAADTTVSLATENIRIGFNGIQIKYVPCAGYGFRCVDPIFFEYIGFVQSDSNILFTPEPSDFVICPQIDSVRLSNIYKNGFNPNSQYFEYQIEYMNGNTGIAYYQSPWDSLTTRLSDYITLVQGGDTIPYVVPHTPYISVVETPNQIQLQPGDFVIISLVSITNCMIIGENNDTTYVVDTGAITQKVWRITSPIVLNNPIENKTTCEHDTSHWLSYDLSSYITDELDPISWAEASWSTSLNGSYNVIPLADTISYFDYEIDFHEYDYPHHIRLNNFHSVDTIFFILEITPTYSTCPRVYDTAFVVVRSKPVLADITTPQYTCDSIYSITSIAAPQGFKYEWANQQDFLYEDSSYQNVSLAKGDSIVRFLRTVYATSPYCAGNTTQVEVIRYGDLDPGEIQTAVDTLCVGSELPTVLSLSSGNEATGTLQYRWLVNNNPILGVADSSYQISSVYENLPGSYLFTRQVQDGCQRGWISSEGGYQLHIASPTSLVPRNANDMRFCFGNAMQTITYFDTIGYAAVGSEQLFWQGTTDSLTPPTGITVQNLNHPSLPISISGTPQESGTYTYTLHIPNAPACGSQLTDTVNIEVLPPLSGGVVEPDIQYTAANLPRLPIQNVNNGSGGSGTNSYQWQYSFDQILYHDVPTGTSASLLPSSTAPSNITYRRVYRDGCGIAYSNAVNIYFSTVEIQGQGISTAGRIAAQNASFVNDNRKLVSFPFINQYGEKLKYNPYMITNGITNLTSTEATFTGAVLFNGYLDINEKGFEISTDSTFTQNTVRYNAVTDLPSTYYYEVTNLTSGTTYYLRAYAINNKGTGYGQIIPFTTK